MSHVSPTNLQYHNPNYYNETSDDVDLSRSPTNPVGVTLGTNKIQSQHEAQNNKPIHEFSIKKLSHIDLFNATEDAVNPNQEPPRQCSPTSETHNKDLYQTAYFGAIEQALQYTKKNSAIKLVESIYSKSNGLDEFKFNIIKYIGLHEKAPGQLVSTASKAYDNLAANKQGFISFGSYFLALHLLVKEKYLPTKNAIHLMQTLIKSSTNLKDFCSRLNDTTSGITKAQKKSLMDVCRELCSKKIYIDIDIVKEKIQQICKHKSFAFHEACNKLIEFARRSNDVNNFNMFIDVFFKETPLAEYAMISAEDLANSPDISFSTMHNFTQTCWFNAICKYILPTVDENNDIVQLLTDAVIKCDTNTNEGIYARFLLQSLQTIFIDLKNNTPVNIQIANFFKSIATYNHKVTEEDAINTTQDKSIRSIFKLIDNAFNDIKHPDYGKIISHDAEEFYIFLSDLIGINSASNTILAENTTEYRISSIDLLLHGIILDEDLTFSVTREHKDEITIYQTTDDTPTQELIPINRFNDLLSRAKGIPEDVLEDITQQLSFCKNQPQSIEAEVKPTEKFFANIDQFNQSVVRTSFYKWENNQQTIDTDKITAVINRFFPDFIMPITDEQTKELYDVKFKPTSILMRRGNHAAGHFFTISVRSSDNKLFIHNDSINWALEDALIKNSNNNLEGQAVTDFKSLNPKDQLLAYIKQEGVYPINIRFAVASKDKK
jgi:hypothetical protein